MSLREQNDRRKAFRIETDRSRQSSGCLLDAVVAILAATVESNDHRPGSGAVEFPGHVNNVAIFRAVDGYRPIQKSSLDLLGRRADSEEQKDNDKRHNQSTIHREHPFVGLKAGHTVV